MSQKYLVEHTSYKHKEILNSDEELDNVDISKLENYDVYEIERRVRLTNRINNEKLKLQSYSEEHKTTLCLDCKKWLDDESVKILSKIKELETELEANV